MRKRPSSLKARTQPPRSTPIGWHACIASGGTFVTRKITRALARIVQKSQQHLYLGNLESKRDWGYTPDFVEIMWSMLQQDTPGDYVVGTGEAHTVREFMDEAFGYADLDWEKYVRIDPRYYRPLEVKHLLADASKAEKELGWKPRVCFKDLVRIMVDADLELMGLPSKGEGRKLVEERFGGWHRWDDQIKSMEPGR
jgi:GDPmannose 4,6-dehydratase